MTASYTYEVESIAFAWPLPLHIRKAAALDDGHNWLGLAQLPLCVFQPSNIPLTSVPLEAATRRPAVVRTGRAHLFGWREMPFADAVRVVAILLKDLRQKAVLEPDRHFRITGRRASRNTVGRNPGYARLTKEIALWL